MNEEERVIAMLRQVTNLLQQANKQMAELSELFEYIVGELGKITKGANKDVD